VIWRRAQGRRVLSSVRFALLVVPFLLGCAHEEESVGPTAEIGIFFGGQMQRAQRIEIPVVRPPKVGFRVHFPASKEGAARASGEIVYEVVRPGPAGRRVTKKGTLKVPAAGEARVDHVLSVAAPRKLGLWNVRVLYGGRILADRALYLTRPLASSR
jgi:hypothetical protein